MRRKISVAQKDPAKLVEKLVSYIIQVRRYATVTKYSPAQIIVMDKMPVWVDMVSETTVDSVGKKSIVMKTTSHDKSRVSLCLFAKTDRNKLKPLIAFKDAKGEVATLQQKLKNRAVIVSSKNSWINTKLTNVWADSVLGDFSFGKHFLAWDS